MRPTEGYESAAKSARRSNLENALSCATAAERSRRAISIASIATTNTGSVDRRPGLAFLGYSSLGGSRKSGCMG